MMKRFATAVTILLVAATFGCGDRREGHVRDYDDDDYDDRAPRRHIVKHVCTRDCHHHYYDGRRMIVLDGHRHGPGCGHVWDDRYWVVPKRKVHRPTVHVCSRDCHGHYYDGGRMVVLRGHRHGPRCGHTWSGKHWVTQKAKRKIKRRTRRR